MIELEYSSVRRLSVFAAAIADNLGVIGSHKVLEIVDISKTLMANIQGR
jgi:hypothetical protein